MKKLYFISFAVLLAGALLWTGCENTESPIVYEENLPDGVKSVESVQSNHPLFAKAKESLLNNSNLKSLISDNSEIAIYTYDNGYKAIIFYGNTEKEVFYQIINKEKIEVELVKILLSDRGAQFESLITDYNFSYDKFNKTWGECMTNAMTRLYDDWENDPLGSISCLFTGPLCAIGGGIACGIQQL